MAFISLLSGLWLVPALLHAADAPAEKPAPLPLHQIEGSGGIFSTLSAYIVNPPRNGETAGRPAAGFSYVHIGDGRALEAFTFTESPVSRLELGYASDSLDLGDLPQAIERATTIRLHDHAVRLDVFSARLQLLTETDTTPTVTLGAHFKQNHGIARIDTDLAGTLHNAGVVDDQGYDYTLYASKLFKAATPVLFNAGLRATKAAHIGLLGFADDYKVVFEANAVVFLTGQFALAAEYRGKPNAYRPVGTLVGPEDDWWTLDAAYVVNAHFTVAGGYGHFGTVLNHTANGVWGLTAKYEF